LDSLILVILPFGFTLCYAVYSSLVLVALWLFVTLFAIFCLCRTWSWSDCHLDGTNLLWEPLSFVLTGGLIRHILCICQDAMPLRFDNVYVVVKTRVVFGFCLLELSSCNWEYSLWKCCCQSCFVDVWRLALWRLALYTSLDCLFCCWYMCFAIHFP
jgi:hypothetical protein